MEENHSGGQENHGERRDYARNNHQSGYSAEGRKLRPRRNAGPAASSSASGEYKSFDSRRNYNRSNRGDYQRGDYQRSDEYGYRREASQGRSQSHDRDGERGYGQRRSFSDNHGGYEGRKPSGQGRPSYGHTDRTFHDDRSSYGQRRPSYSRDRSHGYESEGGQRKQYGQGRPTYGNGGYVEDEGAPRRTFSRRPSSGNARTPDFRQRGPMSKGAKAAGGRKPYRKNEPHFTAASEEGIYQMLSRKPQVDNPEFSDNDMVPTPIKEEIRLNKFIANSGVCSRREADNFIQAGVVTVNGVVVTELGTKVNVLHDDVRFNGERLKGEEKVYIVMNKPKGFVTSASDPHAEKTVMDLLKHCTVRVFPVGRLDKNTTGVLMFTNDGEIAEQLTHPSFNKKKIYQVILDKALDEADKEKILNEGLDLPDGNIKADELEYIDAEDHRRLGIEIHSGKNRIVRRIFESLGYDVKALDRVYFAGLTKKGLKKGEWRYLSEGEVNVLKMGAYV